jgi:hypothetical protein
MPPQPRCAKECCNAKSTQENKYCRKHQLQIFIDETESLGKRVCKNVIRGCTAQLDPNYEFVRCEPCRKLEKERDDARKARALENATKQENPETRFCKNCEKTKPLDEFVGAKNKGYVKSCKDCRETWIRNDKNRDKEHRNALAREASKTPENIATKKAWEAANPDKVEQKIKKSRAKRAAKDIDGYLQHNANVMKNWRDRNPEKMAEANRKRRESIEAHFKIYQRSARLKKLPFTFSEEEFKEMVVKPCYYCNSIDEKGFNGIDRMNHFTEGRLPVDRCSSVKFPNSGVQKTPELLEPLGYIQSNCVSCCAMCNWMKGSLDSATFIKRIRHIHSFAKNTDPHQKYPECFPDAKCVSYASYRSRAEKKDLEFTITNDDYKTITTQDCYLCGKKSTDTNTNGIDRVDNAIGYTAENCKACCKECNHMKNQYALDTLLEKIERIKDTWIDRVLPVLPAQIYSIIQIAEKMTKEELNREKEARKQRALKKHQDYLETIDTKFTSQ